MHLARLTFALAALLVGLPALPACTDGDRPDDPGRAGQTYTQRELEPDVWELRYRWGPATTPVGSGMGLMARCAQITVSAERRWFRKREEGRIGPSEAYVILELLDELPEDYTDPTTLGEFDVAMSTLDPTQFCFDAREIIDTLGIPEQPVDPPPAGEAAVPVSPGWERERETLLTGAGIGELRQLVWLPADGDVPGRLYVGGRRGALWLDADGERLREVTFDTDTMGAVPVDVEGDGTWELMDVGGGWSAVGLREADGATRWSYPGLDVPAAAAGAAPNGMAAGDLDGDGVLEFVIGTNGGGGLLVVDAAGEVLQHHPAGNVFSVAVLDVDGDGSPEVLHSDRDQLVVRRGDGRELDVPVPDLHSFSLVHDVDGRPLLGRIQRGHVTLFSLGSDDVQRFPAADSGHDDIELAWVARREGGPFAAVSRTVGASTGVAELYVYDDEARLVHHEELAASHIALAAVPSADGAASDLFVAAGETLWRYPAGE